MCVGAVRSGMPPYSAVREFLCSRSSSVAKLGAVGTLLLLLFLFLLLLGRATLLVPHSSRKPLPVRPETRHNAGLCVCPGDSVLCVGRCLFVLLGEYGGMLPVIRAMEFPIDGFVV